MGNCSRSSPTSILLCRFTLRRTRSSTASLSIRITATRVMTVNTPSASGVCCYKSSACSCNSVRIFSANAVRCIFSGAASILPSRAFQGAPRRVIPAACRICPTGWRARPIRMNSAAAASGRAAAPSLTRRFMLMPIPNRRATAPRCLPPAVTTPRCGNSCCLTMTYGTPPNPLPCCSNFCNAPMRRPPTWATGIAPRSTALSRRLQRLGPPQQLVDHRIGRFVERFEQLGPSRRLLLHRRVIYRRGNADGAADRRHFQLDGHRAQLLDRARTAGVAVTDVGDRLVVPLLINPIEGIFEHCGITVVVFRDDDDIRIGLGDFRRPALCRRLCVLAVGHGGRGRIVEKRQQPVAEVEQLRADGAIAMQAAEQPVRRFVAVAASTGAAEQHMYAIGFHDYCLLVTMSADQCGGSVGLASAGVMTPATRCVTLGGSLPT